MKNLLTKVLAARLALWPTVRFIAASALAVRIQMVPPSLPSFVHSPGPSHSWPLARLGQLRLRVMVELGCA